MSGIISRNIKQKKNTNKKKNKKQTKMEQKKKRHNPEITPQDLAVSAFDRNNDIVNDAVNLDGLVKNADTSKVEVVKNDSLLSKELYTLLAKIVETRID